MTTFTPKFPAKFEAFPEAWKPLIQEAKRLQKELAFSDAKVAGNVLSATSWNQLANGAYPVPSTPDGVSKMVATLQALVSRSTNLLLEKAETNTVTLAHVSDTWVDRPERKEVLEALKVCAVRQRKGIEERVVIIVGPTRAGKTMLLNKLTADQAVQWRIRVTSGMKRSHRAFLEHLASAMGVREIEAKTVDKLEAQILAKLKTFSGVLAIEEMQRISGRALEFFKDLLNDSQVSLVLAMLPRQYQRMCRSSNEDMHQFLGRCVRSVELEVTESLVKAYAPEIWAQCDTPAKIQRSLVREAEAGGGMSLVREVCTAARTLAGNSRVTEEHVATALAVFRGGVPTLNLASQQSWGASKRAA